MSTAIMPRGAMELDQRGPNALEARSESAAAAATSEVQAAVLVAKRFPRDEDTALQRIERACKRRTLADRAMYSYPRGGSQVTGPSIDLLRVLAGYWGNINYGFQVLGETPDGALIRAFAWDMESNTKSERDHFVERKVLRAGNKWATPDLRDWREWLGNIGSRMERRALQNVIPRDVLESAEEWCAATRLREIDADPDAARRKVLSAFNELNVPAAEIERFLGCPVKQADPRQLDMLRGVYKAIRDGEKRWVEYCPPESKDVITAKIDPADLSPSTDANRGHDRAAPQADAGPEGLKLSQFADEEQELILAYLERKAGISDREAAAQWLARWEAGPEDLMQRVWDDYNAAKAERTGERELFAGAKGKGSKGAIKG